MSQTPSDDMPAEIDFSQGTRGKFFHPGVKLNLPVYLDEQVQSRLAALANAKGMDFSALVNELLRKDIELIEVAR
ncbi:MAG: BrnA antitoxin family protein [Betaproteobacteria bacterium]|nr:BrnA antitoxin family protein [Betaproteobacteria bacterium]